MSSKLRVAGKTDVGLVRSGNEDTVHVDEKNKVFAVCDGMGGHQAGEVASMTAANTLQTVFTKYFDALLNDTPTKIPKVLPPSGELLLKGIRLANRAIYRSATSDSSKQGMGTTIVALAVEADVLSIAHVGDSRAYLWRNSQLSPLTRDHSWIEEIQEQQQLTAEEANSLVGKNVITRALGVRENVEVDYKLIKMQPDDLYMICSDGICGFVDDEEISRAVADNYPDPSKLVDTLIEMANGKGGADNSSAVAVYVDSVDGSPIPEVEVFTLAEESPELLTAEDAWLDRIADEAAQEETGETETPERSGGSSAALYSIFAFFAIVMVLIIYFYL